MADNQHYITKAYLDKFIHPTSSTQNILYPFRRDVRGTGFSKPKGTKNLGSAESFYVQQEDGRVHNKLDEARTKSEALYFSGSTKNPSPLTRCVFEDNFIPPNEDKIMLAGAAALLRCGSPMQIHNSAMTLLLGAQQMLFDRMNSEAAKAIYKEIYGDDAEKMIVEHRNALYKGEAIIDVGDENWKQLGFSSFQTEELWLAALMGMGLTVCTSHYNSFFVTSDNPVVLTCASQPDSPGLGLQDAEIWFPISHNRGLLWSRRHRDIRKTGFGYSQTRVMNKRIIKWCYKEVYSPLPEQWINAAVKGNTFDPRLGYYGSLQRLVGDHATLNSGSNGGMKVVDLLAGLRTGERPDVLGI